jgi:ABC-type branched-subunit amino acid transport system substrate-binding protein
VTRRALALALVGAALAGAGCGNRDAIRRGGTTVGTTLTVYASLPSPGRGAARDIADGAKLRLAQSDGKVGKYTINFNSLDEGGGGPAARRRAAGEAARTAMADTQTAAVIGSLDSAGARASIPLLNEAGYLHVSLGASYPGFTRAVGPDDPERWEPAGRRTFARLIGDDRVQARALVRAAGAQRIVVEAEGGEDAEALAREVRDAARAAGARLAESPGRRGAVVYAGADPVGAAAVAESVAREAPGARVVLPDAVARAGVDGLVRGRARRRTVIVSSAPRPGSTPELRAFEADFERAYGRAPGAYAALGHAAMATVLAAIARAAEDGEAGARQRVIDAFFSGMAHDTVLGRLTVQPSGEVAPARFSTYRPGER